MMVVSTEVWGHFLSAKGAKQQHKLIEDSGKIEILSDSLKNQNPALA